MIRLPNLGAPQTSGLKLKLDSIIVLASTTHNDFSRHLEALGREIYVAAHGIRRFDSDPSLSGADLFQQPGFRQRSISQKA